MRILLTGATGGLGFEIAAQLAAADHALGIIARPGGTPIDALQARCGGRLAVAYADMRDGPALTLATQALLEELRGIDAFIHFAGPLHFRRLPRETAAGLREMLEANVLSAAHMLEQILPQMRAQVSGRCIFFGMTGSAVTRPAPGLAAYGAAKAALVAYARSVAIEEAANGITCNIIEPGDIRDKSATREAAAAVPAGNPSGHAGSWEDIYAAIRFLISNEAAFINGSVLAVGGGLLDAAEPKHAIQ